jgi:DNA-binding GntR family transcriptional regulator
MTATALVRGLRDQIVQRLRNDILAGRLVDGERLTEHHLAQRYGVSRGPVREALVHLFQEGMLVKNHSVGFKVAAAAPDSVRQLVIPLRRTIETYALRVALPELTPHDFHRWDEILHRMKFACEQHDFAATAECDIALHRSIVERARQPDVLAIWNTMVARIRLHFRASHERYPDPMDIYQEHRAMIDKFRSGEVAKAVKALEKNIQ